MSESRRPATEELGAALSETLRDLIAIRSTYPPGDTREICRYIAGRLERAGLSAESHMRSPGIENVVTRIGSGAPVLAFNTHVDTVGPGDPAAWRTDPFVAATVAGRIHGLGANNCKASIAVHLWLAEEIARLGGPARGTLLFSFAGDEERLGLEGTHFLREAEILAPDMLVLGGPTGNALITEERGVMWVEVTAIGRAAHGGDPAAGDNAILRMMRLLAALAPLERRLAERRAGEKRSTMNIGTIHAGENPNVVPDRCTARIDRRLLPGESVDAAYAEITAALAAAGEPEDRYAVARLVGTNGFTAAADGPAVSAFVAAITARTGAPPGFLDALAVSDGRFFADDRIEILNFGPGDGATSHAPNEHVPLAEMVDAAHIQRDVVERLLGTREPIGDPG